MNKRILSLVLALVMVLGTFGTVFAAATTPTGNEKVDKLIELGLVKGYTDGTYGLDKAITRAEVATMVVRALDLEAVANASMAFPSQFTDMNSANVLWARGYVNVAAGQGIVNGYPNGTFVPVGNITYAEGAKMLVEILGGLTATEVATQVWPTTYLAKAAQLGIFDDVTGIVDYSAPAQREKLFEMVYNALINSASDLLIANVVEGIVVENYRTESLKKDEVVVHVMKDQAAKDSKYELEEGEEFKVVITPELKEKGVDVETLLGKVVKISYDKNDKIVGVTINDDYDYLVGELESVTSTEIELDGDDYTVEKNEARVDFDERLYQVYEDNKDVKYTSLVGEKADYAKVTVRNGKVLFIDAFNFQDVAPVAEVKEDGETIYILDDNKDGAKKKLSFDKDETFVLAVADGIVGSANLADIEAMDVIHYNTATDTIFVVLDAAVEGEYEKYTRDKENIKLVIDGESYSTIFDASKKAVYSYDGEDYATLQRDLVASVLDDMEEEEVTILLDMNGKVQLITTEIVDPSFYALVVDVLRDEVRLAKADGTRVDLEVTFDTDVTIDENDGTKQDDIDDLEPGDLVLVEAVDEEALESIELIEAYEDMEDEPEEFTDLTKSFIVIDNKRVYLDEYDLFLALNTDSDATLEVIKGVTAEELVENYLDEDDDLIENGLVYVGEDALVFIKITESFEEETSKVMVNFIEKYDADESKIYVEDEDGVEENYKVLTADLTVDGVKVVKGDVVELTIEDEEDVTAIELLIDASVNGFYEVTVVKSTRITLKDANGEFGVSPYYTGGASVFGDDLEEGSFVQVAFDADEVDEIVAILVDEDQDEATAEFEGSVSAEPIITVDGNVIDVEDGIAEVVYPTAGTFGDVEVVFPEAVSITKISISGEGLVTKSVEGEEAVILDFMLERGIEILNTDGTITISSDLVNIAEYVVAYGDTIVVTLGAQSFTITLVEAQ